MKILITGGAGYIGSTIATALEAVGATPVILDSLVTGPRQFAAGRILYEADVADRAVLRRIIHEHPDITCTIHCAASIIVPESVAKPYDYYRNNVVKSLELLDALVELDRPRVVFSSTGSLYAPSETFEVHEGSPLAPASPYARTKHMMEMAMADIAAATNLRAIMLRYFNPIGSDPDFRSGVYDKVPSFVLGRLVAAARGDIDSFAITGTDLPTRDGTGIRDYIHVWDVAQAHVLAVNRFDEVLAAEGTTSTAINLGTGSGTSVRELLASFERVYGARVPTSELPPRPGDAVGAYANVDKAMRLLGWRAQLSLDDGIASALEWGRRRDALLEPAPGVSAACDS